ncbi:MAG TPA: hypothetical protein VL984_13570 [Acidimicrobiales bacterium]|nr:hypothetical protein [Acidimicrobiales bacterium]
MRKRDRALTAGALLVAVLAGGALVGAVHNEGRPMPLGLSVTSGPPGTLVTVSGDAGAGCSPASGSTALDFEQTGGTKAKPFSEMTVPMASDGLWSTTFAVPGYLGSSAVGERGAAVATGEYQFAGELCDGKGYQRAAFRVTAPISPQKVPTYVGITPTPDGAGYWLVANTGDVEAFGDARAFGSLTAADVRPAAPIVGMARTADGNGYWLADEEGRIYSFGDAGSYAPGLAKVDGRPPITGLAAAPDGGGLWLLGAGGQVYPVGDAGTSGAPAEVPSTYDGIAARPAGGYVVSTATGSGAYAFPGGQPLGGSSSLALTASLVGTAVTPSGNGAWEAGAEGSVFPSGDAIFYGSLPDDHITPDAPVTGIASTPDGRGYWLIGGDGTVFSFGDARFFGMAYDGAS